ncbi:winged helix domain-containing protein [Bosea sp. NPDC003192]|uniref:winged helix domain-containing protein n=1 Tax=Bosea sp. NPDC003192 TaxID=3390551 RepID=UPI003CFFA6D1
MAKRSYPKLVARIADGPTIAVNGREALTLLALIERGPKGVTGVDFPGGPAYRLAAYVADLRGFGVGIKTESESHGVGHHARYSLTMAVEIVSVDRGDMVGRAA